MVSGQGVPLQPPLTLSGLGAARHRASQPIGTLTRPEVTMSMGGMLLPPPPIAERGVGQAQLCFYLLFTMYDHVEPVAATSSKSGARSRTHPLTHLPVVQEIPMDTQPDHRVGSGTALAPLDNEGK